MQTNFTPEQLQNPRAAEAESILRFRRVHCGLCRRPCSTHVMLGDERDSLAGAHLLDEGHVREGRAGAPSVQHHIDRRLTPPLLYTTCPSGVDYVQLVDLARAHIEETAISFADKTIRWALARLYPQSRPVPPRHGAGPTWSRLRATLQAVRRPPIPAMLSWPPSSFPRQGRYSGPGTACQNSTDPDMLNGRASASSCSPAVPSSTRPGHQRCHHPLVGPPRH
ncbi:MAG: hypothetical protein R3D67_01480 [Hyphomicrobiaceae bacterium]